MTKWIVVVFVGVIIIYGLVLWGSSQGVAKIWETARKVPLQNKVGIDYEISHPANANLYGTLKGVNRDQKVIELWLKLPEYIWAKLAPKGEAGPRIDNPELYLVQYSPETTVIDPYENGREKKWEEIVADEELFAQQWVGKYVNVKVKVQNSQLLAVSVYLAGVSMHR